MSSYFKDHVQEIEKKYPHPVDQFIVLSREGHREAAEAVIEDYTHRYTEHLRRDANRAARQNKEFGSDDAFNTLTKFSQSTSFGRFSNVAADAQDIEKINTLMDALANEYHRLGMAWGDKIQRDVKAAGKDEEAQARAHEQEPPVAMIHLQNKLKVLELFLIMAKEPNVFLNEGKVDDNKKSTIPSARGCSVM